MTSTERDIGRLEEVADSLKEQVRLLRQENASLKQELAEIKDLIAQIKGGSRVLFWLGGIASGGVGAALFKWVPIILSR